ncbi:hypothetical protein [Gymnodinialimonas hymeniacidonis]|uniref:hypothetical protein n=1 Tax=Gymnodinialimonas hymeniacidonis TaxID=3126508 RepID=UPI0034C63554
MTRITKLTLCAVLALTPALASAQTLRVQPAEPTVRGLTAGALPDSRTQGPQTPTGTSAWDVICGEAGYLQWWEEDENGNEITGTIQTECLPDDG